jgi:hypothetical protein
MSQLSQNLEKIIQMISIEQLLGLVKQNTDNKSNSDIMNLPIVQKVVKAYEDEIQVLQTPTPSSSLEKNYSDDIAKINEQLASINKNLLQLTEAIRNINFTAKEVKKEELVKAENVLDKRLEPERNLEDINLNVASLEVENVVLSEAESSNVVVEEEHVRLKIEEKQEEEDISKAESELEEESEQEDTEEVLSVAEETEEVLSVAEETEEEVVSLEEETEKEIVIAEEESSVAEETEEEEETEESEKEISDEESVAASLEEESAAVEEEVASLEEEEEEVFEIEIDDVTYYATSEENGILYEVDADGEVGKKVGIIKDGEPIFI